LAALQEPSETTGDTPERFRNLDLQERLNETEMKIKD